MAAYHIERGGLLAIDPTGAGVTKVAGSTHSWDLITGESSISGSALQTLPESGANYSTAGDADAPYFEFDVYFTTTGTYNIWFFINAPSAASDSFHIETPSGSFLTYNGAQRDQTVIAIPDGTWDWSNRSQNGGIVTVSIASSGVSTFRIYMREDGVKLDRIVFADDSSYNPSVINSGDGPALSTYFDDANLVQTITVDPDKVPSDQGSDLSSAGIPLFYDLSRAQSAFWSTVTRTQTAFDFTGSDGASLPAGWTVGIGSFQIQGNRARAASASESIAYTTGFADITVFADCEVTDSTSQFGVVFRHSDTDNFWLYRIDTSGGATQLVNRVGGTFSTIATGDSVSADTVYELKVVTNGSNIKCYKDGVLDIEHTSSDLVSNTNCGLRSNDFDCYADNFTYFQGTIGGDIRVFEADGVTELPREVVSCDTSTETGELHFLADHVDSVSPTRFLIMADGVSSDYAVDATYGRNAVWVDYAAVYHMADDPSGGTLTDSTGSYDMSFLTTMAAGDSVSGQMGSAVNFNGSSEGAYVDGAPSPDGEYTISAWGDVDPVAEDETLVSVVDKDGTKGRLVARVNGNKASSFSDNIAGNRDLRADATGTIPADWFLIHTQINAGRTNLKLFLDGGFINENTDTALDASADRMTIGYAGDASPGQRFGGSISEARFSTAILSADWISTEHNNQSDNASFFLQGTDSADLTKVTDLTINSSEVDGDLTDYVVYLDGADLNSDFWDTVAPDGSDIRIYKSGGVIELPREIVSFIPPHLSFTSSDEATFTAIPTHTTWEIEFCVRWNGVNGSYDKIVADNGTGGQISLRTTGGNTDLYHRRGSTNAFLWVGDERINDGQFHTFKLVCDGSEVVAYMDGIAADAPETNTLDSWGYDVFGDLDGDFDIASFKFWADNTRTALAYDFDFSVGSGTSVPNSGTEGTAASITGATWNAGKTAEIHFKYEGTLSSTVDTPLEIYAGDAALADYSVTAPYGRNEVWSDYDSVLHLNDSTDSTGNYTFTEVGSPTYSSQKIGSGFAGDGFSGLYTTGYVGGSSTEITVQSWASHVDYSASPAESLVELGDSSNGANFIGSRIEGTTFYARNRSSASNYNANYSSQTNNTLALFHATLNTTADELKAYSDGGLDNTNSSAVTDVSALIDNISIGLKGQGGGGEFSSFYWDGGIDEVRVRPSELSSDWISTEYNNQSSPSTFYTASNPGAGAGDDYTLSLAAGAFALTGGSIDLLTGRLLSLSAGSFSLAGGDLGLAAGKSLELEGGTFDLTGGSLETTVARLLSLSAGTFSTSGGVVDLVYSPILGPTYTLSLDSGSVALSGGSVGLLANKAMELQGGTFSSTGGSLELLKASVIDLDSGTFLLTGGALAQGYERVITLEAGDYEVTGGLVNITYSGAVKIATIIGIPVSDVASIY